MPTSRSMTSKIDVDHIQHSPIFAGTPPLYYLAIFIVYACKKRLKLFLFFASLYFYFKLLRNRVIAYFHSVYL